MYLKKLQVCDVNEVLHLFCDCFYEDNYYNDIFPNISSRKNDMSTKFKESITLCIQQGLSDGVFNDSNDLISFILLFDYKKLLTNQKNDFLKLFSINLEKEIPFNHEIHEKAQKMDGRVIYILSIGVSDSYRRKGIASALVDNTLSTYPNANIIGDVSNVHSLCIYKTRNFLIEEIRKDYFLVTHFKKKQCMPSLVNPIEIILPSIYNLNENKIDFMFYKKIYLINYEVFLDQNIYCFRFKKNSICEGIIVQLSYLSLLKYQKLINLSHYIEKQIGSRLIYVYKVNYLSPPLYNDTLKTMISTRSKEWSVIPDIYVSIPVKYTDIERFYNIPYDENTAIDYVLKNLDFRTHFEVGIPSQKDFIDDFASVKNRIKRFYLGKHWIQISEELTIENYTSTRNSVGPSALVDFYISVDQKSNSAILTFFSLSCPFLISHLFDNVIRNQILIFEDDSYQNIFNYICDKFSLTKRGTPKIFSLFPNEPSDLSPQQIASLLASETIYSDGEQFGKIIDKDITNILSSNNGMGQYDRAVVYAYTNVLLQFSKNLIGTVSNRIHEEAITLFYIELILFEEAAINILDHHIIKLLTSQSSNNPILFLSTVNNILDEYSNTIDFWTINLNYPTSQKSLNMLKASFLIDKQLHDVNRHLEQLKISYNVKCDIIDRTDSKRTNTSLAIISILAVFSAWMDSYDYAATWDDILSNKTIHFLQRAFFFFVLFTALYVIFHLFVKTHQKNKN